MAHRSLLLCVLMVWSGRSAAEPEDERQGVRHFFAMGVSGIGFRSSDADTRGEWGVSMQFGQRLSPKLQLVETFEGFTGGLLRASPPTIREGIAILVGVRWSPFALRPRNRPNAPRWFFDRYFVFSALHLEAAGGVDFRFFNTYDSEAKLMDENASYGPILALTVGWLPMQGRDYAFGVEARLRTSRFDDGFETSGTLAAVAQLRR